MSNTRKAKPKRPPEAHIKRTAIAAAKAEGCDCDPIAEVTPGEGLLVHVRILHDEGCPLENAGRGKVGALLDADDALLVGLRFINPRNN